jgi:hypothetical protein
MKKFVIVIVSIFLALSIGLYICYLIDKKYRLSDKVKKQTWEYDSGYYVGDFINPERYTLKGDTMFFYDGQKCIIKYQIFDYLIISDIFNKKSGEYSSLKANR